MQKRLLDIINTYRALQLLANKNPVSYGNIFESFKSFVSLSYVEVQEEVLEIMNRKVSLDEFMKAIDREFED